MLEFADQIADDYLALFKAVLADYETTQPVELCDVEAYTSLADRYETLAVFWDDISKELSQESDYE